MQKKLSSYTDQDIEKINAYLAKHPNCATWTTQEGLCIPVVLLKDDHLDNVIRHQEERLKSLKGHWGLDKFLKISNICLKEKKKRLIKKSLAGRILFGQV
jgi:hypothetical protein